MANDVFWVCPTCKHHNTEQGADDEDMYNVTTFCTNDSCRQGVILDIGKFSAVITAVIPKREKPNH